MEQQSNPITIIAGRLTEKFKRWSLVDLPRNSTDDINLHDGYPLNFKNILIHYGAFRHIILLNAFYKTHIYELSIETL
jgi:hypothetical protein